MRGLLAGAALVVLPRLTAAQSPEYQLRFLTHGQWTPARGTVGVAAWAVLPNVMHEADPRRSLLLGGVLFRNQRRWVEVMAGALVSSTGPTAVLDVRYVERPSWVLLFVEGEYNVGNRRLSVITTATVPARLAAVRLRAGIESEWIHKVISDLAIAGPRLTIALPLCGRWCRDAAMTTALRFQSDGHRVVRQYVGLTF